MPVIGLEKFSCLFCGSEHPGYVTACPETGEKLARAHKLQGTRLDGKYVVGTVIAEGGMGVVYEGTHTEIGRKVAIKFLHNLSRASSQMLERFRNEARIAAAVGHQNIVNVLDMGTTGGNLPYIVMEYLEGNDLATFLEEADRLPQPWAVDITIQLLSALRAVHAKGVVHRDLKPANVYLVSRPDGGMMVKLLDFGISRLKHEKKEIRDLTRTGAVLGTPHYMPPEQARGAKDIDHRADLYSAGIILYRLLTGAFPFDAEDYNNLIIAITTGEPVHVSKHASGLPAGLQAVVMWAISRSPEDRFADADEFIEALLPYRDADPSALDDDSMADGTPVEHTDDIGWGTSTPTPSTQRSRSGADQPSVHDVPTAPPPKNGVYPMPQEAVRAPDLVRMTFPSIELAPTDPPPPPPFSPEQAPRMRTPSPDQPPVPPEHEEIESRVEEEPDRWEQTASMSTSPFDPQNQSFWTRVRVHGPFMISAVALVTMVGGFTLFLAYRTQEIEQTLLTMRMTPAAASAPPATPPPEPIRVELLGMDADADVYVDGVLHPERPLMVEASPTPRFLKVVTVDGRSWENRVALRADVKIQVRLSPAHSPGS